MIGGSEMSERVYFEGYERKMEEIAAMDADELSDLIRFEYGEERLNLSNNPTAKEIRSEVVRQTKLDWLNPLHPDYKRMRALLEE